MNYQVRFGTALLRTIFNIMFDDERFDMFFYIGQCENRCLAFDQHFRNRNRFEKKTLCGRSPLY